MGRLNKLAKAAKDIITKKKGKPGMKIELGMEARDTVSGFAGIVVGKFEYLYGCNHYKLQPQAGDDGKFVKGQQMEEHQIEIINTKKVSLPVYVCPTDLVPLGVTAKDTLIGMEGIVMARFIFIDGTVQYALQPEKKKDEKELPKDHVCGGAHIQVVKDGRVVESQNTKQEKEKLPPGGPALYHPRD